MARKTGQPLPCSVTYQGTQYISGSVWVLGDPVRNWIADNVEVLAYQVGGAFQIEQVVRLANPAPLTVDEIDNV